MAALSQAAPLVLVVLVVVVRAVSLEHRLELLAPSIRVAVAAVREMRPYLVRTEALAVRVLSFSSIPSSIASRLVLG